MYIFEPQVTVAKIVALDRDGKLPSLDGLREDDRHTVLARLDLALLPVAIAGLTPDAARVQLGALDQSTPRHWPAAGLRAARRRRATVAPRSS